MSDISHVEVDDGLSEEAGPMITKEQAQMAQSRQWSERIKHMPWRDSEARADDPMEAMMIDLLNAETVEDVGAELKARSPKELGLIGLRLQIRSFVLAESTMDTKLKCYAIVTAAKVDGEIVEFNIGSLPVVQLVRWEELGGLPLTAKIIEIPSKDPARNAAQRFVIV